MYIKENNDLVNSYYDEVNRLAKVFSSQVSYSIRTMEKNLKDTKSEKISIRISKASRDLLEKNAKQEGVTLSALLSEIITLHIHEYGESLIRQSQKKMEWLNQFNGFSEEEQKEIIKRMESILKYQSNSSEKMNIVSMIFAASNLSEDDLHDLMTYRRENLLEKNPNLFWKDMRK